MKEITSLTNSIIKDACLLQQKKYRQEQKCFLVEGYHLVEEAAKVGLLNAVFGTNIDDLQYDDIPSYLVTEPIIAKLATTLNPQPIIGIVKMPNYQEQDFQHYLVLDDVNDPGNLGTIIRTSAALGVEAILISTTSADVYNEKVIRATQGAIFKIPIIRTELEMAIQKLKERSIEIIVTSLTDSIELTKVQPLPAFALVMGNEAHGVSDSIRKLADKKVCIPMHNEVESLNVGIATGIILYQLLAK